MRVLGYEDAQDQTAVLCHSPPAELAAAYGLPPRGFYCQMTTVVTGALDKLTGAAARIKVIASGREARRMQHDGPAPRYPLAIHAVVAFY